MTLRIGSVFSYRPTYLSIIHLLSFVVLAFASVKPDPYAYTDITDEL